MCTSGKSILDDGLHIFDNHFQMAATTDNLKYEQARYNTFKSWTKPFIDTKKLALYGFYLKESPDIVECVYCKVTIGEWEVGDNVLREHLRWSPNCRLLHKLADDNIPIDNQELERSLPRLSTRNVFARTLERSHSYTEYQSPEFETRSRNFPRSLSGSDYSLVTIRLETFKTWPKSMKQKPEDLSDAGFFYLGEGDQVKCFSCGGGLKEWEESDDPWEQHALYYEKCYYVNEVKSQSFVKAVKQKFSSMVTEQNTQIASSMEAKANCGQDSNWKICQICFDEERCAIFSPCMHVVACIKCSYSCDLCPICRSAIISINRIYFS